MERRVDRSLPLANLGEDIVSIISQSWRRLKKGEFLWIEKKKRKEAIRGRIAQVTCWWILSYLLGWLTIWSGGLGTFYRERANPRSVWALAPSARLASPRAPSVHPLHPIRLGCRPTDKTYATRFVIIFNYVLDGVEKRQECGNVSLNVHVSELLNFSGGDPIMFGVCVWSEDFTGERKRSNRIIFVWICAYIYVCKNILIITWKYLIFCVLWYGNIYTFE